ncbi:MAG: OmpA family protein [Bacteroidales bacterium]|nr:OmpA family protein [Bacteroidales bacterium]
MKPIKPILACVFCLAFTVQVNAQFLEKLAKKADNKVEREAEQRTEKRINKGIDKVFDKVEEGIDEAVKGDTKDKKSSQNKTSPDETERSTQTTVENSADQQQQTSVLTWTKYDFVPGAEIIFEDNQQDEQNGEFPSKWDLEGGVVENANLDGENVIYFSEMRAAINRQGIVPLIKNAQNDYLPEEFTIEFDVYFQNNAGSGNYYRLKFFDAKNQKKGAVQKDFSHLEVLRYTARLGNSSGTYPNSGYTHNKPYTVTNPGWLHVAISFNKRAMKVYLDDARILNIPNLDFDPSGITLLFNADDKINGFVKNIRIAKGAVPLYDKVLTEGKFVTTGIKFDVNQASIRPESMGTINYVLKMIQDNPDWCFSVEGHTDSDGSDTANQILSEKRAEAVLTQLVKLGIASDRLTSKGWGESKPMAGNDTPEGKAQNRRVEFNLNIP